MRFDYIIRARLAGSFREPFSLVFIILAILISLGAAVLSQEKMQTSLLVALVSEDTGIYGERLISILPENTSFSMREMPQNEAMRRLNQDRLEAVVIIRSDFTEKIKDAEYRNTLELYTSPSSQATATISEPLINGVMMLWMEELSTIEAREYLLEHGSTYDASDEIKQREQIISLWKDGSVINIDLVEIDGNSESTASDSPFSACIKWYGVLCLFYLVVAASWVLDINKKSLRIRINQMGVRQWKMIICNSAAPLLICAAGYIVAGTACCIFVGASILNVVAYFSPMLFYLVGILGVTLFTASLLKNILSLMFIAPALTFLNGVLSGLLLEMPDWAYVLKWLSCALPGRWLNESVSGPLKALPWALVCSVAWVGIGIVTSWISAKNSRIKKNGADFNSSKTENARKCEIIL
ncbi:MAG: hypothetical protein CVU91_05955 [Firmicutes bacterium HGW-Firmicutes-16]|nr:MAG: hypothetical protein CVU91_05955 [Firmicutes bacterium HGW-Firmicutes-16]